MEAIRGGSAADTLVSFYPTAAYMSRPSFLEINMADSLLMGFRNALKFALCGGNLDFPSQRSKLVYRVVDGLVSAAEFHHAFFQSSTISEKYFGLVRSNGGRSLGFFSRCVTFLESVLLPHILAKSPEEGRRIFGILKTVFSIGYVANLTQYTSPVHFLFGIRIVRRGAHISNPTSLTSRIVSLFAWALIYSIQLSQWYFSHESLLHAKGKTVPAPTMAAVGVPADPRVCRICRKLRVNPTALLATGHVYCYTCIARQILTESPNADISALTRRLVD